MSAPANVRRVVVQAQPAWDDSGSSWRTLEFVDCLAASLADGRSMGRAELRQIVGNVHRSEVGATYLSVPAAGDDGASLIGHFVRLILLDDVGPISMPEFPVDRPDGTITPATGTAIWHGVVVSQRSDIDAHGPLAGGECRWECFGLARVLDSEVVSAALIESTTPGLAALIAHGRSFNAGDRGNRSATTRTVGSRTAYVMAGAGERNRWTLGQAVDYLTALIRYDAFLTGSLPWESTIQAGLESQPIPETMIHGRTPLEILSDICSADRSLTWRIEVVAHVPRIVVASTAVESISVGAQTHPAAPDPVSIVLTSDLIADVRYEPDDGQADEVLAMGARRFSAITLSQERASGTGNFSTTAALIPDGWSLKGIDGAANSTAPGDDTDAAKRAWKHWRLNPLWKSTHYGEATESLKVADPAYPGTLRNAAEDPMPPSADGLMIERALPCRDAGSIDQDDPPDMRPVLLIRSSSSFSDYSEQFRLTVLNDPPRIQIGESLQDALAFKALLDANDNRILLTVGVREWGCVQARVRADPSTWPRKTRPRRRVILRPDIEHRVVPAQAVLGVNADGTLKRPVADVVERDGQAEIDRLGAIIAGELLRRRGALDYEMFATIEIGLKPGQLALTATTPGGTFPVHSPITRIEWDFVQYRTRISCERSAPGIEARP